MVGKPTIRPDSFIASPSWLGSSISGNRSPGLRFSRMEGLHSCLSLLRDHANLKPGSALGAELLPTSKSNGSRPNRHRTDRCYLAERPTLSSGASYKDFEARKNQDGGLGQLQSFVPRGSGPRLHVGCGSCSKTQYTKSVSACWIPNRLSLDATCPRW